MPGVYAVNFWLIFSTPPHQSTLRTKHYKHLRRLTGTFTKFQALPPTLMMSLLTLANITQRFLRQKLCLFLRRSFKYCKRNFWFYQVYIKSTGSILKTTLTSCTTLICIIAYRSTILFCYCWMYNHRCIPVITTLLSILQKCTKRSQFFRLKVIHWTTVFCFVSLWIQIL